MWRRKRYSSTAGRACECPLPHRSPSGASSILGVQKSGGGGPSLGITGATARAQKGSQEATRKCFLSLEGVLSGLVRIKVLIASQ